MKLIHKKFLIIVFLIIDILGIIYIIHNTNNEVKYIKISEDYLIKENFTIIVLPDTQYYSEDYPEIFTNQTQWIVDNKEILNIRFVIHLGDIVNKGLKKKQWDNANKSMSILDDDNIPYSITLGNHDSSDKTNYSYYGIYFPVSRYENRSWYGGNYDNYHNNYQTLVIDGQRYMFISLDYCPDNKTLDWADKVIKENSDSFTILVTHGFLNSDKPPKREIHVCGSTDYIWNKIIKDNKNTRIVLAGHVHSERMRSDYNSFGEPVYQILSDYQDNEKGGGGYLRIMEFDMENRVIGVKSYSPYYNKYKKDDNSEFGLSL